MTELQKMIDKMTDNERIVFCRGKTCKLISY